MPSRYKIDRRDLLVSQGGCAWVDYSPQLARNTILGSGKDGGNRFLRSGV
jgi:hypothetical protein